MVDFGCRVLCTADIHVGRVSTRLGEAERHEHTCAAVVERLVESALRHRVDVVAIAGDVVDHDNRFFEAFGPLISGFNQLAREKIEVVLVSGNHDWDVLPRLIEHLPAVHFLGADGQWESRTLRRDGHPLLNVVGRSFTSESSRNDPLAGLPPSVSNGAPTLGLLHADLDQPGSRYAPVSLASLHSQSVAMWLLGHVHAPRCHKRPGCPPVLYPGSPQAMDPGERGLHGAWLADFNGGKVGLSPISHSTVRYESLNVNLDDIDEPERFERHLIDKLRAHLSSIDQELSGTRCCVCRVTLTGRTRLFRELPQLTASICEQLVLPLPGGAHARIDQINIEAQPRLDLHTLSNQSDVVGELARIIVALDERQSSSAIDNLLQAATAQINDISGLSMYGPLSGTSGPNPGMEDVRAMLLRQSNRLLDALLLQKGCA